MHIIAIKKFRHKHDKGEIISSGDRIEVDEGYGQDLVQTGLAVKDEKALKDYQNKMLADFQDKNQPVHIETPEQRTAGMTGGTSKSETPEQRTQGSFKAKPVQEDKKAWNPIAPQGPPPQPQATPKVANPKPQTPLATGPVSAPKEK